MTKYKQIFERPLLSNNKGYKIWGTFSKLSRHWHSLAPIPTLPPGITSVTSGGPGSTGTHTSWESRLVKRLVTRQTFHWHYHVLSNLNLFGTIPAPCLGLSWCQNYLPSLSPLQRSCTRKWEFCVGFTISAHVATAQICVINQHRTPTSHSHSIFSWHTVKEQTGLIFRRKFNERNSRDEVCTHKCFTFNKAKAEAKASGKQFLYWNLSSSLSFTLSVLTFRLILSQNSLLHAVLLSLNLLE